MNKLYLYGAIALVLLLAGGGGGWWLNGARWEGKYHKLEASANAEALKAQIEYTSRVQELMDDWIQQSALDSQARDQLLKDLKKTGDFYQGLRNELSKQPVAKDGTCNPFGPGFVGVWNAGARNPAERPE